MKVSPIFAAALVLFIVFPGPNQGESKKNFCVGGDGKHYLKGEHYDDQKACNRYTCIRKGNNLKMHKKKLQCDGPCSGDCKSIIDCVSNPNHYLCKINVNNGETSPNSTSSSTVNNLQENLDINISMKSHGISPISHLRYRRAMSNTWCFWLPCSSVANNQACQGSMAQLYCDNSWATDVMQNKVSYHKDISKICCFIIRTGWYGIWILSDSKYSNINLNCANSDCRYVNLYNKNDERCLERLGTGYTCCSQTTGSLCKKYGGTGSIDNIPDTGTCSTECANSPMANCNADPTNDWCNDEILGKVDSDNVQSAKYIPKAIMKAQMSSRKKRSSWRNCPPWDAWQFDCYDAVRYMLKSKGNEIFEFEGTHYFKKDCCSEFQSKCTGDIEFDKELYKMTNIACP